VEQSIKDSKLPSEACKVKLSEPMKILRQSSDNMTSKLRNIGRPMEPFNPIRFPHD
jgi:hypothetical protein